MATDGSSVISETRRSNTQFRDGGVCVFCGDDPVDVAHIVARKGDPGHVPFIQSISPSLRGFRKDDPSNLLCLCCSHHRQYDHGYFVFVPSKTQRRVLLDYEHNDFARRELQVKNGFPDPGRTLPSTLNEIEYIPITLRGYRAYIHNPTRYDPQLFTYDSADSVHTCPLLHFQASPIALMVQASSRLGDGSRIRTNRGDDAADEIALLLSLYRRHPGKVDIPILPPPEYYSLIRMIEETPHPSVHMLTTIPASPPLQSSASAPSTLGFGGFHQESLSETSTNSLEADMLEGGNSDPNLTSPPVLPSAFKLTPGFSGHQELPQLTPSLSGSTDGSSEEPHVESETDVQLLEYTKEPAMSWDDLKNRPLLFSGEEGGIWQFSSAEQVIQGPW